MGQLEVTPNSVLLLVMLLIFKDVV